MQSASIEIFSNILPLHPHNVTVKSSEQVKMSGLAMEQPRLAVTMPASFSPNVCMMTMSNLKNSIQRVQYFISFLRQKVLVAVQPGKKFWLAVS